MKKNTSKVKSSKTIVRPVSVKFKMKSGETVFFKALRTSRASGNSRLRTKSR